MTRQERARSTAVPRSDVSLWQAVTGSFSAIGAMASLRLADLQAQCEEHELRDAVVLAVGGERLEVEGLASVKPLSRIATCGRRVMAPLMPNGALPTLIRRRSWPQLRIRR